MDIHSAITMNLRPVGPHMWSRTTLRHVISVLASTRRFYEDKAEQYLRFALFRNGPTLQITPQEGLVPISRQ